MFMIIKNKTNLSLQFMNRLKTLKHVQSFDAYNSKKWKKKMERNKIPSSHFFRACTALRKTAFCIKKGTFCLQ